MNAFLKVVPASDQTARAVAELVELPGSLDGGGGPPHDGGMEERIRKLEDSVVRIDSVLPTLATKADLSDMKFDLVKWMVGTAIGLGVAAITVMTFVLNHATPKTPASPTAPIVITIPPPAPAPAGTPHK